MNNVQLIGRLTKDVEIRYTKEGKAVANMTLAIDKILNKEKKEEYKNKGISTANFIRVVIWGRQAENADKYLSKGKLVGVTGSIQSSVYEKDGKKNYSVNVLASRINFIESNKKFNPSKKEYEVPLEDDVNFNEEDMTSDESEIVF